MSEGTIVEKLDEMRKTLEEQHGDGWSRKAWDKVRVAEDDAWEKAGRGDYAKALSLLAAAAAKARDAPEPVTVRLEATRAEILTHAGKALQAIQALAVEEPADAKRDLLRLLARRKGTGLEEQAKEILASLAS